MQLTSLAAVLAFLAPAALAAVSCYGDGQPFDEQWTAKRIDTACSNLKGDFSPQQTKGACQPMGDDHVSMSVHNKAGHKTHLTKKVCKQGMHHIIDECGGFGSDNHGGHSVGSVFDFDFDPNEGGC